MYQVQVTGNTNETKMSAKSKDLQFLIDTKGQGMTPPDTLLASLASCIGVYVQKYFQNSGLSPLDFKVSAEADFVKEPVLCFKLIDLKVEFSPDKLDERRKVSLREFVKNCPVHNTLHVNPNVEIRVV